MNRIFYDCYVDNISGGYVPYQLCPKCSGQGSVSKPPWLAGDIIEWSSTAATFVCDVCHGAKVIPMFKAEVNTTPTPERSIAK